MAWPSPGVDVACQTLLGRRAVAADAGALSALALRSKAIWGYSTEFMARCREELTLTPDQLGADWGFLYEDLSQRGAGLADRIRVAQRMRA